MKLFCELSSSDFSNCYILGSEKENAAIIVDPSDIKNTTVEIIENNNFHLKAVFITHDHRHHVRGLRTLKRIYNVEVYAVNQNIMNHKTTMVKDGDKIIIADFAIEVISIPGHSSDSVVYRIESLLFTGDVLTAGLVGSTASAYGATTQMNKLRSRLLSLPGDYTIFPGHGPPSTLEAERRFNTDIIHYDQNHSNRQLFRVDI